MVWRACGVCASERALDERWGATAVRLADWLLDEACTQVVTQHLIPEVLNEMVDGLMAATAGTLYESIADQLLTEHLVSSAVVPRVVRDAITECVDEYFIVCLLLSRSHPFTLSPVHPFTRSPVASLFASLCCAVLWLRCGAGKGKTRQTLVRSVDSGLYPTRGVFVRLRLCVSASPFVF